VLYAQNPLSSAKVSFKTSGIIAQLAAFVKPFIDRVFFFFRARIVFDITRGGEKQ